MNKAIKRNNDDTSSEVDLTPMLDVVFIMLIFFIVTATFIKEASISLDRPDSTSAAEASEQKNIIVDLHADNQISLEGRHIDHRSLRAYFERHKAANPEAIVIINANNATRTFAVTQVTDAARQAGIYQVTLANHE